MGGFVNNVTDAFGLTDSGAAADATSRAYAGLTDEQTAALEYLREVDALPRQYREDATKQLANIYGFGRPKAQDRFFKGLKDDPFYKAIMGGMDEREEAYLRGQSATGDLRGGESIMGLGDIAQDTRMQALLGAYQNQLGGIQSLMGLPDYTQDIYGGMMDIGGTRAKGIIDVGQAEQYAEQAGMNNLLGLGKLAVGAGIGVPGGIDLPGFGGFGGKSLSGQESFYRDPTLNI